MRFKDRHNNTLVKLFKGSAKAIVEETKSNKHLKYYSQCVSLKALFPFSYIHDYTAKYSLIAEFWGCHKKTAINRISRLIEQGYAYQEGIKTLRFLSNTTIRRRYAGKSTKKAHNYEYVKATEIAPAIEAQAVITGSLQHQVKAIDRKTKQTAAKKQAPSGELSFRELVKRSPLIQPDCVDTPLLSQQKAAKLLGYKSKSSGYRALRRLSMAKFLEIESNVVKVSRDEFNFYKELAPHKAMIRGRGNQAEFFICNANTVKIVKMDKVRPLGAPEIRRVNPSGYSYCGDLYGI